jgi:Fic family protein
VSEAAPPYTAAEDEALARNLYAITLRVECGELFEQRVDTSLLATIHSALFGSVRSHGGRVRTHFFGSETLTFGPNRSVHRDDVDAELEELFKKLRASLASFGENSEQAGYDELAIHAAVWAHAEVVRIHPFEDGNGRSSRLLMNWILVFLGLRPLRIEVPSASTTTCSITTTERMTFSP